MAPPAQLPLRRWSNQPLFIAAIALACGIFLVKLTWVDDWRPVSWLLSATFAVLAIAAYWLSRRALLSRLLVLLCFFLLGMMDYELKITAPSSAVLPAAIFNVPAEVSGTVIRSEMPVVQGSSGGWRTGSFESRQSLDLEVQEVRLNGNLYNLKFGARTTIYSPADDPSSEEPQQQPPEQTAANDYHYGQRLQFPTKLREPHNFNNPGAWDYRRYLAQQGIQALASVKADQIEVLPGSGGSRLEAWRSAIRRSLLQHIRRLSLMGENSVLPRWTTIAPEDGGLLAAMVLGDRTLLHRNIKTDFQKTGSYHLLVVSGLSVAILTFATFWFVRWLNFSEGVATVLSILLAVFYASLTDLGAPIQRAVLMSAIYLCAQLFYRQRQPLNAIGAAALAVLVLDPKALFDAGFQLTFVAVLTIGGIGVPLLQRTSGPLHRALRHPSSLSYDARLEPRLAQLRIELRMIAERLGYFIPQKIAFRSLIAICSIGLALFDALTMSFFMQAAMALPMAIYFHRLSILGLPANMIVIPLMGVLMPLLLITILATYLGSWAAWLPTLLAAILLHLIRASIAMLSGLSVASLRVADPSLLVALAAAGAFTFCLFAARKHRLMAWIAALLLFVASALLLHAPKPQLHSGFLEVTAIDVGQGDSILVITPDGKSLLIDGGGSIGPSASEFDFGEDVVSPYLWARGIEHLDVVALTHAHGDHIGGLASVVANFMPDELWIAPSELTPAYLALMRESSLQGATVLRRTAGEKFSFGAAQVEVLWPPADWRPAEHRRNEESMVLRIRYGSAAALLEGDAEKKAEQEIALLVPQAQLLKVGHHGSNTSTTPQLLEAVRPAFAVISSGAQNTFGHPRPEVLHRLAASGVRTHRTDHEGAVSFLLDEKGVSAAVVGSQQMFLDFRSGPPH